MSTTRPPKQKAPPLTCDCHFHIFGPYDRYPLDAGPSYTPPAAPNVKAPVTAAPERSVWGIDWPHPLMDPAPEAGPLFDQFGEWVPDVALRQRILVDNAARLYGF